MSERGAPGSDTLTVQKREPSVLHRCWALQQQTSEGQAAGRQASSLEPSSALSFLHTLPSECGCRGQSAPRCPDTPRPQEEAHTHTDSALLTLSKLKQLWENRNKVYCVSYKQVLLSKNSLENLGKRVGLLPDLNSTRGIWQL